ncbi:MAG: hypothetical protein HY331_09170, partial [Chloroflexi bacterium]|nr:hypothetical protein [Chloroflexota bacterium]
MLKHLRYLLYMKLPAGAYFGIATAALAALLLAGSFVARGFGPATPIDSSQTAGSSIIGQATPTTLRTFTPTTATPVPTNTSAPFLPTGTTAPIVTAPNTPAAQIALAATTPTPAPPTVSATPRLPTASPTPRPPTVSAMPTRPAASPTPQPPTPSPSPTPGSPTVTPTRTATPAPSPTATPTQQNRRASRLFLGYYVNYDDSSWWTLEAQAGAMDFVAPQWLSIDACGNLGSRDDRTLIAHARGRGVEVIPTLATSSGWLNHQILTNPASAGRAVEQIVDYVRAEGYEGFDLDFEGVLPADRAALTSFVARLSAALRAQGKTFTMALPPKTSDVTTGWAGAFDYAALAPHLDLAIIMTYAYTWSTSAPGSTAPQRWVDDVIAYTTSVIPRGKVLMGVPLWGYDWNVTLKGPARALRYPQAAAVARHYGVEIAADPTSRSATFTYTARAGQAGPADPPPPRFNHEISQRTRPPCGIQPPTPVPGPTATPTATP